MESGKSLSRDRFQVRSVDEKLQKVSLVKIPPTYIFLFKIDVFLPTKGRLARGETSFTRVEENAN